MCAASESAKGQDPYPLELTTSQMVDLMAAAMDRIVPLIATLAEQPPAPPAGATKVARKFAESLPVEATPQEELLDLLFEQAIPNSNNTAGPGYLAYIPGGGLFQGAVAEFIAAATNRFMGVFSAAPALAQIEANVVRWFSEIVGYPESARGFLSSGGSLASFSGIYTAREELLGENFLDGSLYLSDQAHHSVYKATRLAGIPSGNVRTIRSNERQQIDLDELARQIEADRDRGLRPFLVAGNAGTTNTGAIDDLQGLAELADEQGVWLHVDAAYGGFFMLTEEGRAKLTGLGRAHSIVLDPHKGLFMPYGVGSLLVRDGEALRRAHASSAEYLPPLQEDPNLMDFCQISPELTRPFRGLEVWLSIKLHGIGPFCDSLQEKLDLTRVAVAGLKRIEGLHIVATELSVIAFRLEIAGHSDEELDVINRKLLDLVNQRGRVYLSGTKIMGRFVLRICVGSFRTHAKQVQHAVEDVEAAAREASAAGANLGFD